MGTVEDTLRPRSTIGCSAWPCKLIVDLVMEIDLRPQSKGGCVFKEARSARTRTIVVLIVLNLAPRDLSEAAWAAFECEDGSAAPHHQAS